MASKRKVIRRTRSKSKQAARVHSRRTPSKLKRSTIKPGMRTLYPAIQPYRTGTLRVSDEHQIYFEECGSPHGKPVVFVHGGPGAGFGDNSRRFFDPDAYRIVLFDQRGCGRSTPHASLSNNTTWHLVADMEQLREHLLIDKWQVFGGSWGSTLALAYSQTHPTRVSELVLRGIFLLRQWELHWFYQQGASALYPDRWQHYIDAIPPSERSDLITAFHKRLIGSDRKEMINAARAWSIWEASTSFLKPNIDNIEKWSEDEFAVAIARIECHYFVNRGFLKSEDQLLKNVHLIRQIPAVIVQGRYDVVCPIQTAWELHQAWPEADFRIVDDAGHSAFDPANTHELICATDKFR